MKSIDKETIITIIITVAILLLMLFLFGKVGLHFFNRV
jgi:hypothetical protein